jgi:branched-chain amino acid transport system permease protein
MVLATTVALGIVLRELIRNVFPEGSNPHAFPSPLGAASVWLADVPVSWFVLLDLGLTLLLLIATLRSCASPRSASASARSRRTGRRQ